MRQSVSRFRSVRIQRVHTVIRFLPFGVSTIIWCRLGFIFFGVRALIYIRSWATFLPNTVVFPQISQRKSVPSFPGLCFGLCFQYKGRVWGPQAL